MKLELVQTDHGSWKLITKSTKPNPALSQIAELLADSNRVTGTTKIGVFSVSSPSFKTHTRVKSFITGRSEMMNGSKFRKFLKGLARMKPAPKKKEGNAWLEKEKTVEEEKEAFELLFS